MKRQIITNHKRPNRNLREVVPVILDTIRAKRVENEQRIIQVIKGVVPKKDSRELMHLSLKNPVLLQHPSELHISKVVSNANSNKSRQINILHHLRNKLCSDWSDPTSADIITGKRTIMDFFEMAIIDELSHIYYGWSIYMDFINGDCNIGQLKIIKECIERGIRKRPWIVSRRDEQMQMKMEDMRSNWPRIAADAAARAFEIEEEKRMRRINNYMSILLEHPYYIDLEQRQEIPGAWAYYFYNLEPSKNFNDEDDYITDIDDFTDCMSYESL